jgi:hypothetical protein
MEPPLDAGKVVPGVWPEAGATVPAWVRGCVTEVFAVGVLFPEPPFELLPFDVPGETSLDVRTVKVEAGLPVCIFWAL